MGCEPGYRLCVSRLTGCTGIGVPPCFVSQDVHALVLDDERNIDPSSFRLGSEYIVFLLYRFQMLFVYLNIDTIW